MGRGLRIFLAFLGGAIAGWLLSIGAYIILSSTELMYDREGGKAMAFAFVIGPFVALIVGALAAVRTARRGS